MLRIEIINKGITPLLMNKLGAEELDKIRTRTKAPKSAGRNTSPRDDAEKRLHVTEKGKPYIPTEALFATLVNAGQFERLDGKRQVSTAKSTMLPAFLSIEDPYLFLHGEKPGDGPTWEVDMRQGRNPNGGEAVCIVRPRFDVWGFRCSILVDTDQIATSVIRSLWDKAGRRIGLLDFRPQKRGIYGQFVVVSWKEVEERVAAE